MPAPEFDQFAGDYAAALGRGLALTGEPAEFFAQGRALWVRHCLRGLGSGAGAVLDFGCGTGQGTSILRSVLAPDFLLGVDVSEESLARARAAFATEHTQFASVAAGAPRAGFDLAFTNGVFHHVPPADRPGALRYIRDCLRPGGLLAFWENNPWNPGTRLVMKRIPFDRDARVIFPMEARRMLRAEGFAVLRTDYCFFFPSLLRGLRPLERWLHALPLGGQYQVLAQKPCGSR